MTSRTVRAGLNIYKVADLGGEVLIGTFYQSELLAVIYPMDKTFQVYLNSAASHETFPENTSASFTQLLPERISLDPPGEWYCRLTSCNLGFAPLKAHYLLCDCSSESVAGE